MNAKKLVALFFAQLIIAQLPAGAVDQPSNAAAPSARKSIVGEATEAVVGRVFGVEGDASNIKYHVVELTQHSPSNAALRSLVVPGWGQYFNSERVKGTILFVATVGALVGSAKLYASSKDDYDDYKAAGVKDSTRYDDYKRGRNQAVLLGGTAAVLWVVGVVDAYRHAYQPLYSSAPHMELAVNTDGAELRLKKAF